MKLEVLRISSQEHSTNGLLFDVSNGKREFLCYTLEDQYRQIKVAGETRVPAGFYQIKFRTTGGFHKKYLETYGNKFHKGMLHITGIPGFEYILIHIGNTALDTEGCLLVGLTQTDNSLIQNGFISNSEKAYKKIYPKIAEALENGEEVWIHYIDLDSITIK